MFDQEMKYQHMSWSVNSFDFQRMKPGRCHVILVFIFHFFIHSRCYHRGVEFVSRMFLNLFSRTGRSLGDHTYTSIYRLSDATALCCFMEKTIQTFRSPNSAFSLLLPLSKASMSPQYDGALLWTRQKPAASAVFLLSMFMAVAVLYNFLSPSLPDRPTAVMSTIVLGLEA